MPAAFRTLPITPYFDVLCQEERDVLQDVAGITQPREGKVKKYVRLGLTVLFYIFRGYHRRGRSEKGRVIERMMLDTRIVVKQKDNYKTNLLIYLGIFLFCAFLIYQMLRSHG